MNLESLLSLYSERRNPLFSWIIAGVWVTGIAVLDWIVRPNVSLGALYLLPILFVSPILSRVQIVTMAALCSILRERFAPYAGERGMIVRLCAAFAGFAVAGFFVSELHRGRRLVVQHLSEKEAEIGLRRMAEAELKAIIETIPLAVLTIDKSGCILQANESAHRLIAVCPAALIGQPIQSYVPVPLQADGSNRAPIRARLECRARRNNGEPFLAHVWMGYYLANGNDRTAIVIWDGSDDLRDREGAGFDSLMATSRILLGAVSHELRNLVSAARGSFTRVEAGLPGSFTPDFERLGRALAGLEAAAGSALRLAVDRSVATADLGTALDETWIIMEPGFREAGIEVFWQIEEGLPRVRGDQQGLVQVLINLLRNSHKALENADPKKIFVTAALDHDRVMLRVRDTGPGISHPEDLFQVFPSGAQTGLGLYISRSIVLSFGGDLRCEQGAAGACFVVDLQPVPAGEA